MGRDSQIALMILNEAGYGGVVTPSLGALCKEIEIGAGLVLVAAEAVGFDTAGARAQAVRCREGSVHAADAVLLTAGAWTAPLASALV